MSADKIEHIVAQIYDLSDQLKKELKSYEKLFIDAGMKNLDEAGLRDKLAMANLIVKIRKQESQD